MGACGGRSSFELVCDNFWDSLKIRSVTPEAFALSIKSSIENGKNPTNEDNFMSEVYEKFLKSNGHEEESRDLFLSAHRKYSGDNFNDFLTGLVFLCKHKKEEMKSAIEILSDTRPFNDKGLMKDIYIERLVAPYVDLVSLFSVEFIAHHYEQKEFFIDF